MSNTARDALRSKIFARREFKREKVELFGQEIEIRQPSLGAILSAQEQPDRKKANIRLIIDYCYVPDTDEKVFEEADEATLVEMPFDQSFISVSEAIARMTGVNVAEQRKNSDGTQSDGAS